MSECSSQAPKLINELYQLFVYVPESHLEAVKSAMFQAGAGTIGDYEQCAWQVAGTGQFKPMPGSQPFIGEQGALEQLSEYRVEMICCEPRVREVLHALKQTHPYEEPAYGVMTLCNHYFE